MSDHVDEVEVVGINWPVGASGRGAGRQSVLPLVLPMLIAGTHLETSCGNVTM
jgi:hypothetical protein